MRRSASQIIRNLEMRVARLERQASSWDSPENYDHPAYQSLIQYSKGMVSKGDFVLDQTMSGSVAWTSDLPHPHNPDELDLWIFVAYDSRKSAFIFTIADKYGKPTVIDTMKSVVFDEREFMRKSDEVIRSLKNSVRTARLENKSAIYRDRFPNEATDVSPVDVKDMFLNMKRKISLTKKQSVTVRSYQTKTTEIYGLNIGSHTADILVLGPSRKVSEEIFEKIAKIAKPYGFELIWRGGHKLELNHPSGYEYIISISSARDAKPKGGIKIY